MISALLLKDVVDSDSRSPYSSEFSESIITDVYTLLAIGVATDNGIWAQGLDNWAYYLCDEIISRHGIDEIGRVLETLRLAVKGTRYLNVFKRGKYNTICLDKKYCIGKDIVDIANNIREEYIDDCFAAEANSFSLLCNNIITHLSGFFDSYHIDFDINTIIELVKERSELSTSTKEHIISLIEERLKDI